MKAPDTSTRTIVTATSQALAVGLAMIDANPGTMVTAHEKHCASDPATGERCDCVPLRAIARRGFA